MHGEWIREIGLVKNYRLISLEALSAPGDVDIIIIVTIVFKIVKYHYLLRLCSEVHFFDFILTFLISVFVVRTASFLDKINSSIDMG